MHRPKNIKGQRITIKDIAALANVSIGTVDRVLHNRGEVNADTHNRVMSFVKELGYTPNLLAKSLALKKNFRIAVLIPDAGQNNLYWKKPLEGFILAAEELNDFSTKIEVHYYDPGLEKSFVREASHITASLPDGIILAPNFHTASLKMTRECRKLNIPVIFIDNNLEGEGMAYFGQDAYQSGSVAGRLMHSGLERGSELVILNLAANKAITRHMEKREHGFSDYFRIVAGDMNIITRSLSVDLSLRGEPEKTLARLLKSHSIKGIFVTNSRVHKVASYFASAGKPSLLLIGYDLLDISREYMEKGIIDYLICQKPEDQGYKSAMAMFNYLLTGKQTDRIKYSPIDIIIKENLDYYKT